MQRYISHAEKTIHGLLAHQMHRICVVNVKRSCACRSQVRRRL
jgi:hypothetical protein